MMQVDKVRPAIHRGRLLVVAILALLLSSTLPTRVLAPAKAAEPVAGEKPRDPLLDLNDRFHAAYARARKDLLARQGPVILADGESVILLRGGKRTEVNVTPEAYTVVKEVSHIPLGIFLLLSGAGEAELAEERVQELRSYREAMSRAADSLADRALPEDVLKVQTGVIQESTRFLDGVLAEKKVKAEARQTFTRKLGPLLLESAAYSARVQLEALHKQVMAWKADMTAAEWKQLRVLVPGSALPRKGNVRTQYFARLLGEKGEGERIIYAEGLFEEQRALNLLGSYQLDAALGDAFFDDPTRMHRDLLGDAAEAHLKKMNFDSPR